MLLCFSCSTVLCCLFHHEAAVCVHIHHKGLTGLHVRRDDPAGNERLHTGLQEALERACAVGGIVALIDHVLPRGGRQTCAQLLVGQAAVEVGYEQIHNRVDLAARERLVEDDFIQTVEEFRTELLAQQLLDLRAGAVGNGASDGQGCIR